MKIIFKCKICGDIHFGSESPRICPTCKNENAYQKASMDDVNELLRNLRNKRLGRCTICSDLHIGKLWPEICPTCQNKNVYVQIDEKEFKILIEGK